VSQELASHLPAGAMKPPNAVLFITKAAKKFPVTRNIPLRYPSNRDPQRHKGIKRKENGYLQGRLSSFKQQLYDFHMAIL
jgi:hypothetical protein